MRIGELAKAADTTTKALRFYEAERLLPTSPRTSSGYRDYGLDAVCGSPRNVEGFSMRHPEQEPRILHN